MGQALITARPEALRRAAQCLCQAGDDDVRQVGAAMPGGLDAGAAYPLDRTDRTNIRCDLWRQNEQATPSSKFPDPS